MRVRRPRFGVQVVALVPEDHEAQITRPGANIAERVPATTLTWPLRTASQRR